MLKLAYVKRAFKIIATIHTHQLLRIIKPYLPKPLAYLVSFIYKRDNYTRASELKIALEELGPIFIKLGQMLSTRLDLMPDDLAQELIQLQDNVAPFNVDTVQNLVEKSLQKPLYSVFETFNQKPIASASMAQVHFATLHNGDEVAVKLLRPNMLSIIETDIALMRSMAVFLEWLWTDAKRLKLKETINELNKHLHHELDLMREAANASHLKRNMQKHSLTRKLVQIPNMYFDYCRQTILVMQRMHGVPIRQTDVLQNHGVDLKQLAKHGVELFFSQVFRDGFFHADMHPGNILVSTEGETKGQYIALDFGIMGTLSEFDKYYLAHNFLAFFERDYYKVAQLHVESGWVPANTPIEEFESAIRACCEPYFDKPLKEISLGLVLMRLFQTSKEFQVEIQPQLTLLQKTLLNIEGLGRQLDPDLDLWKTAKPILQKWISEQIGARSFIQQIKKEWPMWGKTLPQLPRLVFESLQHKQNKQLEKLLIQQQQFNQTLSYVLVFMMGILIGLVFYIAWLMFK